MMHFRRWFRTKMRRAWRHPVLCLVLLFTVGTLFYELSKPRGTSPTIIEVPQRPEFVTENDILADGYSVDTYTYANAALSKWHILENKNRIFDVGDEIHVTIKIFDGHGRSRQRGGDLVRLWMREISLSACSAGHVIDNKDGTYSGTLEFFWSGTPEIIVAIAGSRETIKIMYKVFDEHKTLKHINAIYIVQSSQLLYEETPCLPSSEIPGYQQVCNYTAENYGLDWYCGKPRTHEVTCFDWHQIVVHNNSGDLPLTKEESYVFEKDNLHNQLRPQSVQVQPTEPPQAFFLNLSKLIPCNERPPKDTWNDVTPVGFFYNWAWSPLSCYQTLTTTEHYDTCLRNRRVLIYGDSTTRQWFVHLRKVLGLVMETQYFEDGQPWHKPCLAVNAQYNYSVFWGPHEMPFYGGPDRGFNRPTYVYLDEIPSSSTDIVVIHYYLHFVSFHPSVFTRHIRRVYQSVVSLVSRAPNVTVALKGPHATRDMPGRIDDYWGPIYDNIIRDTFKPIRHKVLYLDYWDMTVASENDSIHPNDTIVANMVHYMLNSACRTTRVS